MKKAKSRVIVFAILSAVLLCSLYSASALNTDFGGVIVSIEAIDSDFGVLTGLLYRPADSEGQLLPAVVVAHGISESSQVLSGLGLELARAGFVVLVLDLPGHGGSDGYINQGQNSPSLGLPAAVDYLSGLSYVDSARIGLVGHSLGAGAVRAANTELDNVQSTVLIGGGVGDAAAGDQYGSLNATYPKNVLVIVGEYDVLFDMESLVNRDLSGLFNTSGPVQPGVLYGSFQSQSARKLIVPPTTHLFESLDPTAIQQVTAWMQQTLKTDEAPTNQSLIYQCRELAQVFALLAVFGLVLLAYTPIVAFPAKSQAESGFPNVDDAAAENVSAVVYPKHCPIFPADRFGFCHWFSAVGVWLRGGLVASAASSDKRCRGKKS